LFLVGLYWNGGILVILRDESILVNGMISVTLSILIDRFLYFDYLGFSVTSFVDGILVGYLLL
jgi:hypothetical protein